MATVYIVAQKKVVCLWGVTTTVEMVEKVLELAMDVSQNVDGGYQLEQDGLTNEHLARLQTQIPDLGFCEVDMLARPFVANGQELFDDPVQQQRDGVSEKGSPPHAFLEQS